jgi:hypothetical protein
MIGTLSAPSPFECTNTRIYPDVVLAHARRSELKVHAQQVGLYVKLRTTNTTATRLCRHLLGFRGRALYIERVTLGCTSESTTFTVITWVFGCDDGMAVSVQTVAAAVKLPPSLKSNERATVEVWRAVTCCTSLQILRVTQDGVVPEIVLPCCSCKLRDYQALRSYVTPVETTLNDRLHESHINSTHD